MQSESVIRRTLSAYTNLDFLFKTYELWTTAFYTNPEWGWLSGQFPGDAPQGVYAAFKKPSLLTPIAGYEHIALSDMSTRHVRFDCIPLHRELLAQDEGIEAIMASAGVRHALYSELICFHAEAFRMIPGFLEKIEQRRIIACGSEGHYQEQRIVPFVQLNLFQQDTLGICAMDTDSLINQLLLVVYV